MLTQTQKKTLRTLGQPMSALIQIGKGGITPSLLSNLNSDLEAHELVKVSVLKTYDGDIRQAALDCAAATRSEVVHIIGRTFLLYRRSRENKLNL